MTTIVDGGNDYAVKKTGVNDCITLFKYIYLNMKYIITENQQENMVKKLILDFGWYGALNFIDESKLKSMFKTSKDFLNIYNNLNMSFREEFDENEKDSTDVLFYHEKHNNTFCVMSYKEHGYTLHEILYPIDKIKEVLKNEFNVSPYEREDLILDWFEKTYKSKYMSFLYGEKLSGRINMDSEVFKIKPTAALDSGGWMEELI